MKQADQQLQPWTLSFRVRAKRFDFNFNFKYSKILPICKLFRLSIRFKLRPFTFVFETKPQSAFSLKRKLLELKFPGIFKGVRRNRSGSKIWLARENYWFGRRKNRVWIRVVLLAVVSCFVIMLLRFYIRTRFLWKYLWMIWNYAIAAPCASGLLHQFFKVIFEGFSGYLG